MKNMMDILKQAKEMKSKIESLQAELETVEATAASGGGLVSVTLVGKGNLKDLFIDPSLLKDSEKEVLEDLILAAHNEAKKKLDEMMAEKTQAITAGLPIPPNLGSLF